MIQASRYLLLCLFLLLAGCETTPGTGSSTSLPSKSTNKLAQLNTQLGVGYLREGNLKLAWQKLTRALEEDPYFSTAHNAMGLLQQRLGDVDKAEEHFKTAVSINPSDSSAQTNYGSLLCTTGRHQEGVQRFLNALKNSLYEQPELAYNNAGLCTMSTGDFKTAEVYFRAALERNPRIAPALINMSELSLKQDRDLPARAYIQRFHEVAEKSPKSLWLAVQIERRLGDQATARRFATILEKKYPDSRETGLLLDSKTQ